MPHITVPEFALIASTLLGPIVAVQVSQWLDRRRQRRTERFAIFRDLMVTRARVLDARHVEALNLIDVVFSRRRHDGDVREAWRRYHRHLNSKGVYPEQIWLARRIELMNDLLQALARNLRYDVERSVIESAWYAPEGAATLEQEQHKLRQGLVKVLDGQAALPVQIVAPPPATQPGAQPAVAAGQQHPDVQPPPGGNGAAATL